jgi:spore germination cell wall hydrolase CwlJ-like protein
MLKSASTLDDKGTLITKSFLYLFCFAIVLSIVIVTYHYKLKKYVESTGIPVHYTAQQRVQQLECLALNIYKEAGYEPFEGKVAVAQVTINRANHSSFPDDICQVVYQKNFFYQRVVCQFSWYCDRVHRERPVGEAAYNESYEVAKKVLLENFRLDALSEALYYHADYVNPKWNKERLVKIGRHIFYKEKNNI